MSFDAAAQTYDKDFTYTQLGLWLREIVRDHLPFKPGDHILEIGCGTGEDAIWLAQKGIHVTATDAARQMLAETDQKARDRGLDKFLQVEQLDVNQLMPLSHRHFDGVLSNFGVVNCAVNRRALADYLADYLPQGAKVVIVMMNPLCAWEIGWYMLHAQPRTAFRRLRANRGLSAHAGGGSNVQVWYPTAKQLQKEFKPAFDHVKTVGVGAFLPPSYLEHIVRRYPAVFQHLASIDRRYSRFLSLINDHYLITFKRS